MKWTARVDVLLQGGNEVGRDEVGENEVGGATQRDLLDRRRRLTTSQALSEMR